MDVARAHARAAAERGRTCRARLVSRPDGREPRLLVERVVVPGAPWETLAADLVPTRSHTAELILAVSCDPAPEGGALARAVRWKAPVVERTTGALAIGPGGEIAVQFGSTFSVRVGAQPPARSAWPMRGANARGSWSAPAR